MLYAKTDYDASVNPDDTGMIHDSKFIAHFMFLDITSTERASLYTVYNTEEKSG